MMQFKKAERKRVNARIAFAGPTGSGKTFTALFVAGELANHFGEKVAVIDTERESASIYADRFHFDVVELDSFTVQNYIEAINAAADAGYGVLVIDSLSHAWAGKGGVLEAVDKAAKRMKNPNSYMAWREGTTLQDDLVEAILRYPGHILVTMRSKMDYVQDKDNNGKTVIRKIGMAPVQRDGLEYEFTIVGDMDLDHNLVISKSRCEALADQVYPKPGKNFTGPLIAWLDGGIVAAEQNEADHAAENERKQLAIKVQAWFKGVVDNGVCTMDVKAHRENWLKKWFGATDPKAINDAPMDKLTAALADLEEKVAADYREQAHSAEVDYEEVIGTSEQEFLAMSDLRDKILRKPLTGEPTNSIDEASPNTLKKYIAELNKIKKEKAA